MFAHQVIESLKNSNQIDATFREDIIKTIMESQKFSAPTHNALAASARGLLGRSRLFFDETDNVVFPYPICWFDYHHSLDQSMKFGTLIRYDDDTRIFNALFFGKMKDLPWGMDPVGIIIRIGKYFDNVDTNIYSYYVWSGDKPGDLNTYDYVKRNLAGQLSHLHLVLLFLNCKNIETVKNYPPQALNKKRLKHHKQPLFTYHTLVIKPVGKKQESIPRHLWENRIHLCRGHFKTYTEEKPLFGHITGRFWWQPSVRGRSREGVVMKDYLVANGASNGNP